MDAPLSEKQLAALHAILGATTTHPSSSQKGYDSGTRLQQMNRSTYSAPRVLHSRLATVDMKQGLGAELSARLTCRVLDYTFELLRTIYTGIVAVAEWYNFRIPTLGVWQRGSQSGRTAPNHLADQFEVVNESSCLPGQSIINTTKSFVVWFGSFLEINLIHRTICRFNMK